MGMTSFEEFSDLASRGTFVPVCKELMADLLTPVSAYLKIAEQADYAFLLESVAGGVVLRGAAVRDGQQRDIDGQEGQIFVNT